jgi:hypothetical protein
LKSYGSSLAPIIGNTWTHERIGNPTDPIRFNDEDLLKREASYGRLSFNMQFMLDTTLNDLNKYPLKLSDLTVMSLNPDNAPEKIIWASSPELKQEGIPNVGLQGDAYYRPMQTQGEWLEYTGSVMSIDPAGKGKDETAYCVTKFLNGNIFILDAGGFSAGYTEHVLNKLTQIAKKNKVNKILIEENFGQGMFEALLQPYLRNDYKCTTELVRQTTNKHRRILDTLEPLISQHRIIVDANVIKNDYEGTNELYPPEQALKYQLFYQISRLQKGANTLAQDDRIDAMQIACQYWQKQLAKDQDQAYRDRKDDMLNAELEKYYGTGNNDNSWIKF